MRNLQVMILLAFPILTFAQSFNRGDKAPEVDDFPMTFECYTGTYYKGSLYSGRGKDSRFAQIQVRDEKTSFVKFSPEQNDIFDPMVISNEGNILRLDSQLSITEGDRVTNININVGGKALMLTKEFENSYKFNADTSAFFKPEYLQLHLIAAKSSRGESLGAKCFYRPKKKKHLKEYKRFNLPLSMI